MKSCNFLLLLALTLAMATSAFSHNYKTADLSPELAAFFAAGGSLSDLCHDVHGDDSTHHEAATCESCRLVGAAVLPVVSYGAPVIVTQTTKRMAFVAKRLRYSQRPDPARLTRAPPQA